MNRNARLVPAVCCLFLFGCASWQQDNTSKSAPDTALVPGSESAPTAAPAAAPGSESAAIPLPPKSNVRTVRSADGTISGEIVGTPALNSKFAKLQIGMTPEQVEDMIGQPEDTDSRVTGKQFQPFYLGGDTQRMEYFYMREGWLIFSNIQIDSAADALIRIVVDANANASGSH